MSASRKTVLLIGSTPPPLGGMSIYTQLLLDSDLSQRWRFVLLPTNLPPAFEEKKTFRLLLTLKFLFQLLVRLLRDRIELVHIHTGSGMGFYEKSLLTAVCKLVGKPVILHIHGGGFARFLTQSSFPGLIISLLNLPERVIVLSETWYRLLADKLKNSGKRLLVLENMIDTQLYSPRVLESETDQLHVLYLGLYTQAKGFQDMLEVVKKCAAGGWPLVFDFAGDQLTPAMRAALDAISDAEIREHGLVVNENKISLFRQADIFVLPSYVEGMPLVLLEALSFGLPVIATRVGSIPDVVVEKENGFLVEPGAIEAIVSGIRMLREEPDLRDEISKRNRHLAESRFAMQSRIEQLHETYSALLETGSKSE